MNILYIEPYYVGSHKQWIESYSNASKHSIDIISLKASKWKWRMHGGAITLAYEFKKLNKKYDLIISSDYLNLPVFRSYCRKEISATPIITYFHENQLSYPWPPYDEDNKLKRDLHYHFINYSTSLVSDWNLFNSKYHMDIYFDYLKKYLKKMPDLNNMSSINEIVNKSDVLHLGCNLQRFSRDKLRKGIIPTILWNHRWEYDKNPELFFNTLFKIQKQNIDFKLIIIGKSFERCPDIFHTAKKILKDNIIQFGFCDSFEDYNRFLNMSDILPITSNQDFFGISAVEGVYCGSYPLLPSNLSFPEIFDFKNNSDLFYEDDRDFFNKLILLLKSYKKLDDQKHIIEKYDWSLMSIVYDDYFLDIYNKLTFSS